MEWKKLSDKHKLKPGEVVIESSVGRLILCQKGLCRQPREAGGTTLCETWRSVTTLEYMEE